MIMLVSQFPSMTRIAKSFLLLERVKVLSHSTNSQLIVPTILTTYMLTKERNLKKDSVSCLRELSMLCLVKS
jgi:hypothetical protein